MNLLPVRVAVLSTAERFLARVAAVPGVPRSAGRAGRATPLPEAAR